jgi:hypothetical protein
MVWIGRQYNSRRSLVLFGDRVHAADIDVDVSALPRSFAKGRGLGELLMAADDAGVLVEPPGTAYLT